MTQRSVSYTTLILVIITTAFVSFVVYMKFDAITKLFQSTPEQQTVWEKYTLEEGQVITLSGILNSDGDLRYYTHTLQTQSYGIVGIKSKTINLSVYKGNVQVTGHIAGATDQTFIVDVDAISLGAQEALTGLMNTNALYSREAALYFPEAFFEKYTLAVANKAGELSFTDTNGGSYSINYFRCTNDQTDTDCKKLQTNLGGSATKSFTTTDGMTFSKLNDVNSRYTQNNGFFGYFINDMPEETVIEFSKLIIFPTMRSVERQVIPQLSHVCTNGGQTLGTANTYTLLVKSETLHLIATGSIGQQQGYCDVVIDYSLPYKAALTQFTVKDMIQNQVNDTAVVDNNSTPPVPQPVKKENPFNTNVKQFPINLEKSFVFNSNKGYAITFPSQNISFAGENTDTDLGFGNMRCNAQINIVSYPNATLLKTDPSVIIYECSRVSADVQFPTAYIRYPLTDNKIFVIHILDGSRRDFANNISFQTVIN